MMAAQVPYAVVVVELKEGVRMLSNLVHCDPGEAHVGMSVQITWAPLADGKHLPLFEPRPA